MREDRLTVFVSHRCRFAYDKFSYILILYHLKGRYSAVFFNLLLINQSLVNQIHKHKLKSYNFISQYMF